MASVPDEMGITGGRHPARRVDFTVCASSEESVVARCPSLIWPSPMPMRLA